MNITVFGSGYVGLVTAACLADAGNHVVCVDVDSERIARLERGEVPFFEPGLEAIVERNFEASRLVFSTDARIGVEHGLFQFIAVGTPPDEDGSANLQYVLTVARAVGTSMDEYRILVTKSTVPVGTAEKVRDVVADTLRERGVSIEFDVVSNPEFLKEGAAVSDFTKPDRIIVGTDTSRADQLMKALYAPFNRSHDRMVPMGIRSAELTKYAANAMLATKISFMNELANLAEKLDVDIEDVRIGIGSDPRIGYHFIYPGCGYGGSCFPKDVKALIQTANDQSFDARLLRAVESVNEHQKSRLFEKINRHFVGDLTGRTFAVWGLSFKPQTDDMREASSRVLIEALWVAGAAVRVYDPVAMDEACRIWGSRDDLRYCESPEEALKGSDGLVLVTEWKLFHSQSFAEIAHALNGKVIFDGRNIYDPHLVNAAGLHYYGIGRNAPLL